MTFSKNRNLAFICFSPSFGGLELSTIRLAEDLNNRGAETLLVVQGNTPMAEEALRRRIQCEVLNPRFKFGDLLASRRLARIMRSRGTQVAVLMQSKDINLAAVAKLLSPGFKIVFYQQMQSRINKRDAVHTWMYSKLSLWITLTQQMKKEVIEHTRVPERLISVVPLGRDTRAFDPEQFDASSAKKERGLPLDRPILTMIGRLDPLKGQEEFLRSIPAVHEQRPEALFVIAGDETKGETGYRRALDDLAAKLGIREHVLFLPFTEKVPELLAATDIFVMPSHSETYGLVLIEAMAMGKSVVATNAGGVPEIVRDGHNGILVPPRDEHALAGALLRLLNDSSLRQRLSRNAREDAMLRFDSTRCIDQLVAALDAL